MNNSEPASLSRAIYLLDAWFQTMRAQGGYAGPVVHWWQSCLLYCGPMADWRYEGLICGYLNLYNLTYHSLWLERAMTAGEDLLRAQLPDGHFWNSGFEVGPILGGTPHEAAVDVALLELAYVLNSIGDQNWETFFHAAERNLIRYQLGELWNGQAFKDQSWNNTLVPNKNATIMEALLLYEVLSGRSMQPYLLGAAELILSAQVAELGMRQGATIHFGSGPYRLAIGIYTARCLAALIRLYQHSARTEFLDHACRMLEFLLRLPIEGGTLFGIYPNGQKISCPTWISASGDLLRAMLALRPYTFVPEWAINQLIDLLISSQTPSGGIPTAYGLRFKGQTRSPQGRPDFRDQIPVVGWCDKAFRALTLTATSLEPYPKENLLEDTAVECEWKGIGCLYLENTKCIQLVVQRSSEILYEWNKGEWYPDRYQL